MVSPSDLLSRLVVAKGYGFTPPLSKNAPANRYAAFVDAFPDQPAHVVCCNTNGNNRGDERDLNGCPVNHPGVQVRVRAQTREAAYAKAKALYDWMATVRRESLTIDTETYRIDNLSVQGEPIYVGTGMDDTLPSFVFDLFMTYTKTGG